VGARVFWERKESIFKFLFCNNGWLTNIFIVKREQKKEEKKKKKQSLPR
jgi:hypothetical protein